MKKLLCILLTLTMILSQSVPAFAVDISKTPEFKDGAAQPVLLYSN